MRGKESERTSRRERKDNREGGGMKGVRKHKREGGRSESRKEWEGVREDKSEGKGLSEDKMEGEKGCWKC